MRQVGKVRAWNNQDVPISSCVAYCKYHHYYLTKKQLKRKECLKRKCIFLKRMKHNFWNERERKKGMLKAKFKIELEIEVEYKQYESTYTKVGCISGKELNEIVVFTDKGKVKKSEIKKFERIE